MFNRKSMHIRLQKGSNKVKFPEYENVLINITLRRSPADPMRGYSKGLIRIDKRASATETFTARKRKAHQHDAHKLGKNNTAYPNQPNNVPQVY